MKMLITPGYRILFGDPSTTYDTLVKDIPSDCIISYFSALNNELNSLEAEDVIQKRLQDVISERFTQSQIDFLNNGFSQFITQSESNYQIFGRRYLLEVIIKELNNYRDFKFIDTTPEQEFNLLMAYFIVVDEVNIQDEQLITEATKLKNPDTDYLEMLWTPIINQYEFNDQTDAAFEMYKLLCFSIYCLNNYRSFLKKYLNSLGLLRIAELIGSYHQIIMGLTQFHEMQKFKMLNYLKPENSIDTGHLNALLINNLIGQNTALNFASLKSYPLYLNKQKNYLAIDVDSTKRKVYRGPFFELRNNTDLKTELDFNSYSSKISYNVLEKICFRAIMNTLNEKRNFIYFDDQEDNVPDCYYREDNDIFLFEFKAYAFPVTLTTNANFQQIKQYIDSRFINNQSGSNKGIKQIANQIELLYNGEFKFDPNVKGKLGNRKRTIYPIICHNEFHFSLPGVNKYLNNIFETLLDDNVKACYIIKPLTLIDMKIFFDLALKFQNFSHLKNILDSYFSMLINNRKQQKYAPSTNSFFQSNISFDEAYRVEFDTISITEETGNNFNRIKILSNITQEQIDTVL